MPLQRSLVLVPKLLKISGLQRLLPLISKIILLLIFGVSNEIFWRDSLKRWFVPTDIFVVFSFMNQLIKFHRALSWARLFPKIFHNLFLKQTAKSSNGLHINLHWKINAHFIFDLLPHFASEPVQTGIHHHPLGRVVVSEKRDRDIANWI